MENNIARTTTLQMENKMQQKQHCKENNIARTTTLQMEKMQGKQHCKENNNARKTTLQGKQHCKGGIAKTVKCDSLSVMPPSLMF